MSNDSIHVMVTVGIITFMFAWVPFLNVVCPPGWRSAGESPQKKKQRNQSTVSVAPLSSARRADQSREILDALSTRKRVPPNSCTE
jgi:hypothetical protein